MAVKIQRHSMAVPLLAIGLCLLWGTSPRVSFGQTLGYELTDVQVTQPTGSISRLLVDLSFHAEGFSVAVGHPPGLTLISHGLDPSLTASLTVEFSQTVVYPDGATVIAYFDGQTLPPGVGLPLVELCYACEFPPPIPNPPVIYELEDGAGRFGTPPTNNTVVIGGLAYDVLQFIPAQVICMPVPTTHPSFVRFDCNDDGAANIADPIFLAEYLFLGGSPPPCFEACESNLDGTIDLADIVTQLGYHFTGSSVPAPPFPECGVAGPLLDCVAFSSCP